jgi:hypothetical protein
LRAGAYKFNVASPLNKVNNLVKFIRLLPEGMNVHQAFTRQKAEFFSWLTPVCYNLGKFIEKVAPEVEGTAGKPF